MTSSVPYSVKQLQEEALPVLVAYMLLCQYPKMSLGDLSNHLLNHSLISKKFEEDTLNRMINTLQEVGCKMTLKEEQGHLFYCLEKHPLKPMFSSQEQTTLEKLAHQLSRRHDKTLYKHFCELIDRLGCPPEVILEQGGQGLPVSCFQQYCLDSRLIEISTVDNNTPIKLLPQRLVSENHRVFLKAYQPEHQQHLKIDLATICTHQQLDEQVLIPPETVTVVFKLTGRLALNYRPYPKETIVSRQDFLLVTHKTDDLDSLLLRLMKYGALCQVVSPAGSQKEMLHRIEHLLTNLQPN